MYLILTVILIILFLYQNQRISALEGEIQNLRSGSPRPANAASPAGTVAEQGVMPHAVPGTPPSAYVPLQPAGPNVFVEWLKKDLFMKIGALFLLMGLGWFVSYAFMNNWIGEAGRITLGLSAGALFLILGVWRIRTHEHQGAVFTVLGSSTVLLTVFAARELYGFFTPMTALLTMFLAVLFVTFVSLTYRRNSLALAGLILAAIAPYFTNAPSPLIFEQFTYLFVVVLGTLWIVYYTGWRNLTATALTIVFLETLPYLWTNAEKFLVLLFVFLFVATFFVANIVSILRVRGAALSQAHLFTAFGTAFFLILWVFSVAPEHLQSLLFVAWMFVFSFGAYAAYLGTSERAPFYVYGATSIALLGAATTAELSGPVLIIAYTFEIAAVIIASVFLRLEQRVTKTLSLLFAVPMLLSLESLGSRAWDTGVIHGDFFVILILALVLSIVGLFMREQVAPEKGDNQHGVALVLFGILYALSLVWLVFHALLTDDVATMLSLTVYTLVGLGAFLAGRMRDNPSLKTGGAVLLGLVAGRLLLIDVWMMDLFGRIVTFLVIGALFISTAFFARSRKNNDAPETVHTT